MKPIILVVLALAAASPALAAGKPFDWDRYHARQDACSEKDRILLLCALVGPDRRQVYCDDLALRQAQRDLLCIRAVGHAENSVTQLDLDNDETQALLNLLVNTIEADHYPLSPRVQMLRQILGKLPS